ncbi:unnamed protein product [Adineta ricciae]|uniref:Uncharacterized protein n=1 Tax=Adineta ricciae TaxID=249248 RepID=A0A814VXJ2_ADIRI|nr:unnamed protein product [Adineta ricciae]
MTDNNNNSKSNIHFENTVHPEIDDENPSSVASKLTKQRFSSKRILLRLLIVSVNIIVLIAIAVITITVITKRRNANGNMLAVDVVEMTTPSPTLTSSRMETTTYGRNSTIGAVATGVNSMSIYTTTIFSTSSSIRICDILACRSVISDYISRDWAYNTANFGECQGCTLAVYPNYPADWSNRWYTSNILIPSSAGQDCAGNPYHGNIIQCQTFCLNNMACVGFGRSKTAANNDSTQACWLKNNTSLNQIINNSLSQTIIFNMTS